MKQILPVFTVFLLLASCAQLQWPGQPRSDAARETPAGPAEPEGADGDIAAVPQGARRVEEFDTTTAEQKAAAVAAASGGGGVDLGLTIASLGSPSEPGFWLKTPLVDSPAKGRVSYPQTGRSVEVDLIPIDGPKTAGSRMSLSAMRLVGAPFVGLPEVRVYRTGG